MQFFIETHPSESRHPATNALSDLPERDNILERLSFIKKSHRKVTRFEPVNRVKFSELTFFPL